LLVLEAAVAEDGDGAGQMRDQPVLGQQQRGHHAHDGVAPTQCDELPVLDQAPYAGDLHVQPLGDVGEGEPFGDEVSEVVQAPRVPRGRPCPHPAPPPRALPLTIRSAAVRVWELVWARPTCMSGDGSEGHYE